MKHYNKDTGIISEGSEMLPPLLAPFILGLPVIALFALTSLFP